jgi:competence protein ComEA
MFSDFNLESNSEDNSQFTDDSHQKEIDYFKPNNLSIQGWIDLGFSEKQANSIIKYKDSYGPFEKASDVGKIYVISEEKFKELKPFMQFDDLKENDYNYENTQYETYVIPILNIEVNSATADELEEISGIGPAFSARIIKYRNILGGFATSDQYSEVYGLKDESLNALVQNTVIDKSIIEKVNVNTCSKSELKSHPLFKKWEVVSAILTERQKAKLTSLDFLKEEGFVTDTELAKMIDYTSFE